MTNKNNTDFFQLIATTLTIKAYDHIADKNTAALYQMGLNDEAINCLTEIENKDIRVAITALEQALSIQIYIDPHIIKTVMVSNGQYRKKEFLINELVRAGISYEMMRYFFKAYTNRQHTKFRKEFKVNNKKIYKKLNAVPIKVADKFFSTFYSKNKPINAEDILYFSQENNYYILSVWRQFKIFIKNTAERKQHGN
jgi:DNA polymerase III delta prime subunit